MKTTSLPTNEINNYQKYLSSLKSAFLERDEMIDLLGLGLVTGLPTCFIGEPGTSKTNLIEVFANNIKFDNSVQNNFFGYEISKYTHPDEIYGKTSLKRYKEEDIMVRNTENSLIDCNIAFLDEIFKANPNLLNSTLKVSNEKKFNRGANEVLDIPLKLLTAASNEYPTDNKDLRALWDRWIIRSEVSYVRQDESFIRLLTDDNLGVVEETIDWSDIQKIIDAKKDIQISKEAMQTLISIRNALKEMSINCSDRRWRKISNVLKSHAIINGDDTIKPLHCRILSHVIWENPEDKGRVALMLSEICGGDLKRAMEIFESVKELRDQALKSSKINELVRVKRKIVSIFNQLNELERDSEVDLIVEKSRNIMFEIKTHLQHASSNIGFSK